MLNHFKLLFFGFFQAKEGIVIITDIAAGNPNIRTRTHEICQGIFFIIAGKIILIQQLQRIIVIEFFQLRTVQISFTFLQFFKKGYFLPFLVRMTGKQENPQEEDQRYVTLSSHLPI
ncbi:hypothetical protein D3C80_1676940 [compost metagenome]